MRGITGRRKEKGLVPFPWSFARALVPRKKEGRLGTRQVSRAVVMKMAAKGEELLSLCALDALLCSFTTEIC